MIPIMADNRANPQSSSEEKDVTIVKLLRQQAALANFGSFAFRETDLLKVLTEAARVCAESLETSFCKVCRYRLETNDLLVEAGVGWKAGVVGNVVSRADRSSPQGRAFVTAEPTINLDLRKNTNFSLPAFYADHGIVSTVDVIIKGDGQPYGVLEIDSDTQHNYDQHDIDFLTGFANVLAEAVATSERTTVLVATIEKMKALVAEKNVLAEELQHRVRNNLQLVYAMLVKEMKNTDGGKGDEGYRSIARRVMTLAQVYDHLLGTGMSRTVEFGDYLKSLCTNVVDFQAAGNPTVTVTCKADPMLLDLDTVTVLGIVVAELISNSYRHAFPKGAGTIAVQLSRSADDKATLGIADNGVGFENEGTGNRHGMSLVTRLMDQIKGSAEVLSSQGTAWTLQFPCVSKHSAPDPIAA
jgi:two-component sensor histidine kinase